MLRRGLIAGLAAAGLAGGTIWPEHWYTHKRTSLKTPPLEDRAVWEEYGLEAAEVAGYGAWKATAYRLKDPTSALAVYYWIRPAGQPSPLEKYAVQASRRLVLLKGNYVLDIEGYIPTQKEVDVLHVQLPRLDQSSLPTLLSYVPLHLLSGGWERYAVGPASLARFEPRIPATVAAFSMGAEAHLGRYTGAGGDQTMALFSYPTPQIARDRAVEFGKVAGATVKRTGPLVALVFGSSGSGGSNAEEAEKLLGRMSYQATITWNERQESDAQIRAKFLLNLLLFTGALLLFALLCGILYAGVRVGWRRKSGRPSEDPLVTLRLGRE